MAAKKTTGGNRKTLTSKNDVEKKPIDTGGSPKKGRQVVKTKPKAGRKPIDERPRMPPGKTLLKG